MEIDTNQCGQPVGRALHDWSPPPFLRPQVMVGRLCTVAPLDPRMHAESLYAANMLDTDGRMWTYLSYGPFQTFDAYRAWLDEMCRAADPSFFAIVDNATGRALGVASYLRIDPRSAAVEVGHLAFSPALQQTPLSTEAMYLMMTHAFATGYRRYEWKCDSLNAPSRAAAQRLGFSFEGIFRQATVVKGRNRDTAWYAVVDTEWPRLQRAFSRWLAPDNFDQDGAQRERLSDLRDNLHALP